VHHRWVPAAIGVVAGVTYSGFLVYVAFPSEGIDATTVVSTLEAEGAPYGALLRGLDALSAILTLVLVPYLWWALPGGVWRQVAVWSTAVFAAFGIPAGLIALPCAEGEPACPGGGADELRSFAHDATSIVSTTALIVAAGATALAVRRDGPRWLVRAGWLTVAVQVATGLVFGIGELFDLQTLAGSVQRVEILGISAWVICLGVYASTPGVRAPP
jgi:Protein of unknown function (DUF998)